MQGRNEQYLRNLDKKLQKFLEDYKKDNNLELESIIDELFNVSSKLEKFHNDNSYYVGMDKEADELEKIYIALQNLLKKLSKYYKLFPEVEELYDYMDKAVIMDFQHEAPMITKKEKYMEEEKEYTDNFDYNMDYSKYDPEKDDFRYSGYEPKKNTNHKKSVSYSVDCNFAFVKDYINSIKSKLNDSSYKFDDKAFCEFLSKVLNTSPKKIKKLFADDLDYIKNIILDDEFEMDEINTKKIENRYNANVNCFNETGNYIEDYDTEKYDINIEDSYYQNLEDDEISELYNSSDEEFWGLTSAHILAREYGLFNDDVFENVSMFNPSKRNVLEGKNYYYAIFSNPNPDKNWNEKLDNIMKLKKYYDENQDKQELAVETYLMYKEKGTLKVDVNSKRLLEMLIEINEYLSKGFEQGDFSKLEDIPQSFIDHLNEKYGSSDIGSMPSGNFVDAEENVKSNNRSM